MENFIVKAVVLIIIGCAIGYIMKAKKKGVKCVGCPYAKTCGNGTDNCSCNCDMNK